MGEKEYCRLKEAGVMFQANLPSLTGAYGVLVKKKVEELYAKAMINLYGTDTHTLSSFNRIISFRTFYLKVNGLP